MEEQNKTTEKLTDKAFSRLVLMSVLAILICIVCLCSTTYAWFTDNVPSNGNQIKSAESCDLSVTVTHSGIELTEIENGVELVADEVYTVTLTLPSGSASGYCLIEADGNVYYSEYIARHTDETAQTVSFTVKVKETQTVTFTKRWGIYSDDCNVVNGGELLIP